MLIALITKFVPFLVVPLFVIFIVVGFAFFTRSALNNLKYCLLYLLTIPIFVGVLISSLLAQHGYISIGTIFEVASYGIGYILVWVLIVKYGQLETVKLATLILAQLSTALYLLFDYFLNFISIIKLNQFLISNKIIPIFINRTPKESLIIMVQTMIYPVIISALVTYLIAGLREYKKLDIN
jgi:hypothetical protein